MTTFLLSLLLALGTSPNTLLDPGTAAEAVAIENGMVHTMLPDVPASIATVLIVDGKVQAVGVDLELPRGTRRIDATGKHVIPALIDGYVSFDPEHDLLYTAMGIGLVRDVGGEHAALLRQRPEEVRARALGPSLITAGAVIDGDPPSSASAVIVRNVKQADTLIPILIQDGVDFLSLFTGLDPVSRARVIELGHAAELEVWGPIAEDVSLEEALADGQDGFHFLDCMRPRNVSWEIVLPPAFYGPARKLIEAGAPLVPMFHANQMRLEDQATRPDTLGLLQLLSPSYTTWWQKELDTRRMQMGRNPEMVKAGHAVVKKQGELLKLLFDRGVHLVPGSGSAQPWLFPGRALHEELVLWNRVGIPAADILHLATRGAAEAFGLEGRFGSIEEGALGSVLVLPGDPREDVGVLRSADQIVVRGVVLESGDIEDVFASVAQREEAKRAALNAPLEIAPPPMPDGAVVILEGSSDTLAYGLRISSERFRVGRLADDRIVYSARIAFPNNGEEPKRSTVVTQTTEQGKLVEATVALHVGAGPPLILEGVWAAETWRMRRTVEGRSVAPLRTSPDRPRVLDVGSVTTLLALGQLPLSDRFPVMTFHEALEPESLMWSMQLDDAGNHVVRTHQGLIAFLFDENGAVARSRSQIGAQIIDIILDESEAFGGPGLVLPVEKREMIAEREAAMRQQLEAAAQEREAAAAAEAASDAESTPEPEDG